MRFHCWFVTQAHAINRRNPRVPCLLPSLTLPPHELCSYSHHHRLTLDELNMRNRKEPNRHDASAPPAKKQAAAVNGTRSHPGAGKSRRDRIEAAVDTATTTTRVTRKRKRGAISQLTDQVGKRPKRLSTELRPLKANAELRARLRAEEEEAARPMLVGSLGKSSVQY